MTTVCYDGKTLAADRQLNGGFKQRGRKIWRLSDGRLFGGAGVIEQIILVREWLDKGGPKPRISEFNGIVIEETGKAFRYEGRLVGIPILESFHAAGSGAFFGMAAMACGKTAREAVLIAARFDSGTGGGVDVLTRDGLL